MYKDTGDKITSVANIVATLLALAAFFGGIYAWVFISNEYGNGFLGFLAFLGISTVGCVAAWLSALPLAGFGELISNTSYLEEHVSELLAIAKKNSSSADNTESPLEPKER